MKHRIILTALAALLLAGAGAGAQGRERVEVAFVLDSTGSMGGLIEGAKQKIWSIANSIIADEADPRGADRPGLLPRPRRRVRHPALRPDRGHRQVFRRLQSFTADGGGDEPESVNQALNEAVRLLSWSKESGVLRIVFLVGDCPPHMDYRNDVKYALTCREAAQKGIIINTVQCGDNPATVPVWQEIARLAEGSYVALEQAGGMTVVSTPFDERDRAAQRRAQRHGGAVRGAGDAGGLEAQAVGGRVRPGRGGRRPGRLQPVQRGQGDPGARRPGRGREGGEGGPLPPPPGAASRGAAPDGPRRAARLAGEEAGRARRAQPAPGGAGGPARGVPRAGAAAAGCRTRTAAAATPSTGAWR